MNARPWTSLGLRASVSSLFIDSFLLFTSQSLRNVLLTPPSLPSIISPTEHPLKLWCLPKHRTSLFHLLLSHIYIPVSSPASQSPPCRPQSRRMCHLPLTLRRQRDDGWTEKITGVYRSQRRGVFFISESWGFDKEMNECVWDSPSSLLCMSSYNYVHYFLPLLEPDFYSVFSLSLPLTASAFLCLPSIRAHKTGLAFITRTKTAKNE